MKAYRFITALLCLALLSTALVSCSNPPEFSSVKDEFIALIEASVEINDIFFGAGLPVYDREESTWNDDVLKFHEESKTYYSILKDEKYGTVIKYTENDTKKNVYLRKTDKKEDAAAVYEAGGFYYYAIDGYVEKEVHYVYDEKSPKNYDYVLLDAKYQSIASIKEAAEKVYTPEFLATIYVSAFDGIISDTGKMAYARYSESDSEFFMKSNKFEPYFTEHCTYDFSTMKMTSPSREDYVNVTITAHGRHFDHDKREIVTESYEKTLKFVLTEGGWRLDSPTY
jgi:hypothetical protein